MWRSWENPRRQGCWEPPSATDHPGFFGEGPREEAAQVQSEWPQGSSIGTEMETSVCRPGREAKTQILAEAEKFHPIISQQTVAEL